MVHTCCEIRGYHCGDGGGDGDVLLRCDAVWTRRLIDTNVSVEHTVSEMVVSTCESTLILFATQDMFKFYF
jgi:hypothetical protein